MAPAAGTGGPLWSAPCAHPAPHGPPALLRRSWLAAAFFAIVVAEWLIHVPLFNVLLGFPIQFVGLVVTPYLALRYYVDKEGTPLGDAEARAPLAAAAAAAASCTPCTLAAAGAALCTPCTLAAAPAPACALCRPLWGMARPLCIGGADPNGPHVALHRPQDGSRSTGAGSFASRQTPAALPRSRPAEAGEQVHREAARPEEVRSERRGRSAGAAAPPVECRHPSTPWPPCFARCHPI